MWVLLSKTAATLEPMHRNPRGAPSMQKGDGITVRTAPGSIIGAAVGPQDMPASKCEGDGTQAGQKGDQSLPVWVGANILPSFSVS